jgi:tetratricopeptide (TPR) repeat protein
MREQVLARCQKALGPEHPDTLSALLELAISDDDDGRFDKAIETCRQVLTLRQINLGPEHSDTLKAMSLLSQFYANAGQRDESLRMTEELLALCRKSLGVQHPETLIAMDCLALAYEDSGRRQEALKLGTEVLTLCRSVYGPEHPETLWAMSHLAYIHHNAGDWAKALQLRGEVVDLCRKVLGSDHPDTLTLMHSFAQSHYSAGNIDEALKILKEVLTHRRRVNGADHRDTHWAMDEFARYCAQAGRLDESLAILEELLPLRDRNLGPAQNDTLWTCSFLADAYITAGRWQEARELVQTRIAAAEEFSIGSLKLCAIEAWLGDTALHAKTSRQLLEKSLNTADPATADRAAKAYCLVPSTDPALLQIAVGLARRAADLGQKDQWARWYQLCLGMAEYRQGNYRAADKALLAAIETVSLDDRARLNLGASQTPSEVTARIYYAMSLYKQGRTSDAEEALKKAEAGMKLPPINGQPLKEKADHDDLICWLAYKEARMLMRAMEPNHVR